MGRYELRDNSRPFTVLIALMVVLILAVVAGLIYFYQQQKQTKQQTDAPQFSEVLELPSQAQPLSKATQPEQRTPKGLVLDKKPLQPEASIEQQPLPPLADSDSLFRNDIVSVSPGFSEWLQSDNLISKYLTIVNDFSQGLRIYKHIRFLRLNKPFQVLQDQRGIYIDPQGYRRYDQLAAAINALNIQETLTLYHRYRPLFVQVFTEFGYPEDYRVEDIFAKAVANILAAPVLEGRIDLVRPTVRYKFSDKKLEALNPVLKQMLRMGPQNTRIIQNKLRLLIEALLAAETQG